jgi:hypothetical protein
MSVCQFCFNAYVYAKVSKDDSIDYFDTGLDDSNDFSSATIGASESGIQMYFNAGAGKPCEIEVLKWNESRKQWDTVAGYYPKFCPECGRELDEYAIGDRGRNFTKHKSNA